MTRGLLGQWSFPFESLHGMKPSPLGVVINGLTGFAWVHHRAVLQAEEQGLCRLLGYCDHQPGPVGAELVERYRLRQRGVPQFNSFSAMLDAVGDRCALAFIPSPPLVHANDHAVAVRHGTGGYLEKPPSLDPAEFAGMLQLEAGARRPTWVGFNHFADPVRLRLKERVIAGEFGRLRRVDVSGFWPRPRSYYTRATWPGRLKVGDQLLLDSVFGNAMSHYIHAMLFWAETRMVWGWARVAQVEAELYRAHAIESVDTLFARGKTETGIDFRLAFSHACTAKQDPVERLECDRAVLEFAAAGTLIRRRDGGVESVAAEAVDSHDRSILRAIDDASGKAVTMRGVTLADCASFVELHGLLYVAGRDIHPVPTIVFESEPDRVAIAGIEEIARLFMTTGALPTEQGIAWARGGGAATPADASRLPATIEHMLQAISVRT
jgi:predicted dehydrogenase